MASARHLAATTARLMVIGLVISAVGFSLTRPDTADPGASAQPIAKREATDGPGKGREKTHPKDTTTTTTSTTTTTAPADEGSQIVRGDDRRLVLAAYYPWFGTDRYDDPTLSDRPIAPSSVYRYEDVERMSAEARGHGIDGFAVSWAGNAHDGKAFRLALDAAAATNGVVTPYFETPRANAERDKEQPADPEVVRQWLYDAVIHAYHYPAFLKHDGVPVVFVYRMQKLPAEAWQEIIADFEDAGLPILLVGDAGGEYDALQWGWHRYGVNQLTPETIENSTRWVVDYFRSEGLGRLPVGTVSPGYDDTNLRGDDGVGVVERGPNGERYAAVWEAVLSADPDWVFITSWNEWFEGTHVQPSEKFGDLALRQTAEFAARFKTG